MFNYDRTLSLFSPSHCLQRTLGGGGAFLQPRIIVAFLKYGKKKEGINI